MEKKVIVSYSSSGFQSLKAKWAVNDALKRSGVLGSSDMHKSEIGGNIEVRKFDTFELIESIPIPGASGFFYDASVDILYCNSLSKNLIYKIENFSFSSKRSITPIKHRLLNRPHSIISQNNFFYVTSTGIDSVLIFDSNFKLLDTVVLPNLGFNTSPLNEPVAIDVNLDYSSIKIPTLYQSTHINSAYPLNRNWLLISLFHQGEIRLLDLRNKETFLILANLKNPHGCKPFKYGFYICDSLNGRVILLDKNLNNPKVLIDNLSWIQDAEYFNEKFYLLESNECKVTVVDMNGEKVESYQTNPECRSFNVKVL